MNSENSKPEWFQMADADATPPQPKGKRVVRIMALATPLFVLGAGLVFAQTQDSPTAVASSVTSAATPAAATPAADPITISSTTAPTATSTQVGVQVRQASPTTKNASITITKPAIATMPTGGGEDDGIERDSDDD